MLSNEARIFVDSVMEDASNYGADNLYDGGFQVKLETRIEAFERELVDQTEKRFIESLRRESRS